MSKNKEHILICEVDQITLGRIANLVVTMGVLPVAILAVEPGNNEHPDRLAIISMSTVSKEEIIILLEGYINYFKQ